jgi:hypothetical protein
MLRAVSACASPFAVSREKSLLPWMRPSAFQVLWPWRTSTTRRREAMGGSGSGGASTRSPSGVKASDPRQP